VNNADPQETMLGRETQRQYPQQTSGSVAIHLDDVVRMQPVRLRRFPERFWLFFESNPAATLLQRKD
jgi:hypothetical protein